MAAQRATTLAYYALFHTLAQAIAVLLIGPATDAQMDWLKDPKAADEQWWIKAYRILDHRKAKDVCRNYRGSSGMERFTGAFVHLQELRHIADYHPFGGPRLEEAQELVDDAAIAIQSFHEASESERRAFLAAILITQRR